MCLVNSEREKNADMRSGKEASLIFMTSAALARRCLTGLKYGIGLGSKTGSYVTCDLALFVRLPLGSVSENKFIIYALIYGKWRYLYCFFFYANLSFAAFFLSPKPQKHMYSIFFFCFNLNSK